MALVPVCLGGFAWADEAVVSARITHEIPEGIYVDVGKEQGLEPGFFGLLRLEGGRVIEFQVVYASKQSSLLRFLGRAPAAGRWTGQAVELTFETSQGKQESAQGTNKDKANGKSAGELDGDFVPLLAPSSWVVGQPESRNISHGQVTLRHMLQSDKEYDLDYSTTYLNSSGTMDRIEGTEWSFEWYGNVTYRDGDAYRNHPEYQEAHLDLFMASFQRALEDDGFFRFGRFLPRELPGIGYMDGIQAEVGAGEGLHVGAVAGFKPDRRNLDVSGDEPTLVTYATFAGGEPGTKYYSGTAGILTSLYKGSADRLALLLDQRIDLDPRLSLYSTAELDFDVGGAEKRTGTRLTRLDAFAAYELSSSVWLRAGVDHWERPDNQAERELLAFDDDRFFDSGSWRYWAGSDQELPWDLRLSEEVAIIESASVDYDPYWRVGLTRRGLFSWEGASATMTIYNLPAKDVDGYGGRLSCYLPFFEGKLYVQPIVGFQMAETEAQSRQLDLEYVSVRVNGRISANWAVFGGVTKSGGDKVDSTLLDFGLRYSW
jgi:hypothetical protein